jgi:membrane fusion protein, multidrug efflux system
MKSNDVVKILKFALLKVVPIIVGGALMLIVVAWMIGFFEPKLSPEDSIASSGDVTQPNSFKDEDLYTVQVIVKDATEESVGTLKAAERMAIAARVLAPIEEMPIRAGQRVEQGQTLVVLDRRSFESQLLQAEANQTAAAAGTAQSTTNFERMSALRESNSVSVAEYDRAQEQLLVAEARLVEANAAVDEANIRLSYTEIVAPRAGIIVDRIAQPGDLANPGVPLLHLYDPESLRLEAPIPERRARELSIGQPLKVEIGENGVRIQGIVDEVVPQADVTSRSFLVKLTIPQDPTLFEGLYGIVLVPAGAREHLCLHHDAIRRIGQLEFVTVVREDPESGETTTERRAIKTGQYGDAEHLEVLSGLEAGEQVLLLTPQS